MAVAIRRIGRRTPSRIDKARAALKIVERGMTPPSVSVTRRTVVLVGAGATAAGGAAAYLIRRGKSDSSAQTDDGAATASAPSDGAPKPEITDRDLVDKVETIVFRDDAVPKGDINVEAVGDVVTLRGQVESAEMIGQIVERTEAIPEVQRVENLLHQPDERAPNAPSPQDAAA